MDECAHDFTLTCLPQPAQRLPTPLIFTFNPRKAIFFYVLLQWGGSIRTSLVGGPYNLTHKVVLRPTKGNLLSSLVAVGADDEQVYFLCSNGSWIHGAWVLPNSAVSYYFASQCSSDDLTSVYRPHVDMTPATRVLQYLSLEYGKEGHSVAGNTSIDCPMPESVTRNIPGYSSVGYFFKPDDFEALFCRKTVKFGRDLFNRVAAPERVHALPPIRIDPDIACLFLPTIPNSWKGMSRDVREMLETKNRLPEIRNISRIFPVMGDHVFQLECSIDGGRTFSPAHVLLSLVTTVAKRLKVFNASNETVDMLMSFLYGEDKHGNNWVAQLAKQAEANKKAEARRRLTEVELRKLEEETIAHDADAELAQKMEEIGLARILAPRATYALSVEEQARLTLEQEKIEKRLEQEQERQQLSELADDVSIRRKVTKRAASRVEKRGKKEKIVVEEEVDIFEEDDDDDDEDNGEEIYKP